MGGSSSSRKATTYQTTNYQLSDQSYRAVNDSYNTTTDFGAIKAAFNFSGDTVNQALRNNADTTTQAFDFSSDTLNRSLNTVDNAVKNALIEPLKYIDNATNNALDFAQSVSQQAVAPDSKTLQYGLIGAGLIAAAMVLKK